MRLRYVCLLCRSDKAEVSITKVEGADAMGFVVDHEFEIMPVDRRALERELGEVMLLAICPMSGRAVRTSRWR